MFRVLAGLASKFRVVSRRAVYVAAVLILFAGILLVFQWKFGGKAIAAWADDAFGYRVPFTLSNSGTAQTDYQVKLTLDTATLITAGKMQSNCNDVRVTDYSGKQLPYWIETGTNACNTSTTAIWTKIPSLPAGTNSATVYLYYGNPSAGSLADGNKVFVSFDDFKNGSLDTTKWNASTSPAPVIPSAVEGSVTLTAGAAMVSTSTLTDASGLGRIIARVKQAATNLTGGKVGLSNTNTLATNYHNDDAIALIMGSTEEQTNQTASTNLVSHHQLEETTATDANQFKSSGYFDTGKLSQAVSMYGNAAGTTGSTLTFNRGAQISGNNYEHFNDYQGTINVWLKPNFNSSDNQTRYIFGEDTSVDKRLKLYISSNVLVFARQNYVNISINSINWTSGNWYHLVVRWDDDNLVDASNRVSVYINGAAQSFSYNSWTAAYNVAPSNNLFIGSDYLGASQFQGLIDDFAIFDRVLSNTEITQIYNSGSGTEAGSVADPSLKFYAKMDGTGTLSPVTYNAAASASKMQAASSELTGGTNILLNGSLEAASGGAPTSWSRAQSGGTLTWEDAEAANILYDARSQKLTHSGGCGTGGCELYQNVTLTGGSTYSLSFWYKLTAGEDLYPRVYNSTSSVDEIALNQYLTSSSWTKWETVFKVTGSGSKTVRISFRKSAGASDTVSYFDNLSLVPNLVDNGGLEVAGAGGADIWSGWFETAGDGALADETTLVHSGGHAAKLTSGPTLGGTTINQTFTTVVGTSYLVSVWTRGDGTNGGALYVYDGNGGYPINIQTGVTGTTYTLVRRIFKATTTAAQLFLGSTSANGGIAYFDDVSVVALDNVATSFQSWTPVNDSQTSGSELATNTGFETYTGSRDDGTSDTFTGWSNVGVNDGAGDKIEATATANGGSAAVKITRTTSSAVITQNITTVVGKSYKVSFYTRGDGSNAGRYGVYAGGVYTVAETSTGITGTAYIQKTLSFVATSTTSQIQFETATAASVAYFDDVSIKEQANPLSIQGNVGIGVTSAVGARNNAYVFDGSTGYLRQKTYAENIGTLTQVGNNTTTAEFSDTGQTFTGYATGSGTAYAYMIVVTNSDNTTSWGYLGASDTAAHINVHTAKGSATRGWNGTDTTGKTPVGYEIRKTDYQLTGAFTAGVWFKGGTQIGGSSHYLLVKLFTLDLYSGTIYANVSGSGGGYIGRHATTSVIDNAWHYITMTYDGGTTNSSVKIFIDGTQADNGDYAGGGAFTAERDDYYPFYVGADPNTQPVKGSIDSPFVLGSALTASQIQDIYNSTAAHYGLVTNNATTNSTASNAAAPTNDTSYHTWTLTSTASNAVLTQDGTTISTNTTNLPNSPMYIRLQNADPTNALTVDWIGVAKQASTAPTVGSAGTAETGGGPVAYWKFDDGTGVTAQDSTSNNNDGTLSGTTKPTWQTEDMCVSGKCLKFNGSTAYLSASDATSLDPAQVTVEGWVKFNSNATSGPSQTVAAKLKSAGDSYKLGFIASNTGAYFSDAIGTGMGFGTYDGSTWHTVEDTTAPPSNTWTHYAGTYDGSNLKIYVNGILKGTKSYVGGLNYTSPSSLAIGGEGAANYLNGFSDDVKIYPYARTAAQVKADFASRGSSKGVSLSQGDSLPKTNALSNGLVGYWKMDEASWNGTAGEVLDASGNGNNGVAACDGGGCTKATTAAGKFGNGGSFDGFTNYATISSASIPSQTGSVSLWTYVTSNGDVISAGVGDNDFRFTLGSQLFGFYIGNEYRVSYASFPTNQWAHAVLTWDQKNGTILYINSTRVGSNPTPPPAFNQTGITIGRHPTSALSYLGGKIDDLRIYNRALSPAEVRNLYNFAPGPVRYYQLDDGSGTAPVDSSGNGATGSFNGSPSWVPGKYGKGLKLNGSGQSLQVPNF